MTEHNNICSSGQPCPSNFFCSYGHIIIMPMSHKNFLTCKCKFSFFLKKTKEIIVPVSYTHLDVYKRQVAVMRKFILLIPLIYIMPQILKSNQTMAVYMAEPIADILAVTFTAILFTFQFRKALDVYKRQGYCHLEALGDRDGVLKAKTEMFDYMNENPVIILNGDDDKLITVKAVSYTHLPDHIQFIRQSLLQFLCHWNIS